MAGVTPYTRYPHLRGDLITFTAADDVWLVPTSGGRAWRLTDDKQPVRTPRISPDGTHIAFISFRDGHPEVYVATVDGSEPVRRLTWWGAKNTLLLGWLDESSVLVASHAGEPNLRNTVVKKLDIDGTVDRLDLGPAWGLAIHPEGAVALRHQDRDHQPIGSGTGVELRPSSGSTSPATDRGTDYSRGTQPQPSTRCGSMASWPSSATGLRSCRGRPRHPDTRPICGCSTTC